jgi:hypothetical protein
VEGGGAQIMYINVSKCKNDKIKGEIKKLLADISLIVGN